MPTTLSMRLEPPVYPKVLRRVQSDRGFKDLVHAGNILEQVPGWVVFKRCFDRDLVASSDWIDIVKRGQYTRLADLGEPRQARGGRGGNAEE